MKSEIVSNAIQTLKEKCLAAGWTEEELSRGNFESTTYWAVSGVYLREGEKGVREYVDTCKIRFPERYN